MRKTYLSAAMTALILSLANTTQAQTSGTVGMWGGGGYATPVAAQSGVTAIAAGDFFILALKNDGSVVAWGIYEPTVPVAVQSGVTAIAAGGAGNQNHAVALKNDGSVVAWGDNTYGAT